MKIRNAFLIIAMICLCSSAYSQNQDGQAESLNQKITAEIIPGKHYSHTKWFGIFPVKLTPQIAVWVETTDGEYFDTIFVSKSTAEDSWRGTKEGRPEALPVYSGIVSGNNKDVDTVSGATPKKKKTVKLDNGRSFPSDTYLIKAEVNVSFDYNSRYPESLTGVNGQPSIIYEGNIDAGTSETTIKLKPSGTGSIDGSDGEIRPGISGLSTALEIIDEIIIKIIQ